MVLLTPYEVFLTLCKMYGIQSTIAGLSENEAEKAGESVLQWRRNINYIIKELCFIRYGQVYKLYT